MVVSSIVDYPTLPRAVTRAVARSEGDAFAVVQHGKAGARRIETWRVVDAQGDLIRAEIARLLSRGRSSTVCPIAREYLARCQQLLARYEEMDAAEDEHIGVHAAGHARQVVEHGLRVVSAHEAILTGSYLGGDAA